MKKIIALALCALMIVAALCGCSKTQTKDNNKSENTSSSKTMQTVLNTAEYTLYQNIFYNDTKADYNGKPAKKEGIFTTVIDSYNNTVRYYVWGYNDQTKCCDWQWEIKLDKDTKTPSNGSLVTVEGTYEVNEAGLDGFWIINPKISVKSELGKKDVDIDMQTMSNTLERVQVANIINNPEDFEGKSVCGYGRILDEKTLEDAYYDGSWTIPISGDFELPAFGTLVLIEGTIKDGTIAESKLSENTIY